LNHYPADGRVARAVDQLLDLLLVFTLLGAPLIFYTRGYDVFEFNKITVLRVVTTGAAGLMLFKLLFVRPLTLIRSVLDVPVLAWLLVCLVCVSPLVTVNWRLSTHGVYEDFEGITTWFMYVFLFWWPLQHVRTERQIRLVIGAVVLAGTVAGFYGLLQNFGIDFVPWNPDTYNPERMFSTMGNPNFLAAYTVMSMPITFAIFLDLPDRIRTDKLFCTVLVIASVFASGFLALLFRVDYFNLDPSSFGAADTLHMLLGLKFWVTKGLIAFPVICAVLLYYGRLRWILLLSLGGQLMSTLFTKSRGGVFAMTAVAALFAFTFAFELFGMQAALLITLGGLGLFVAVFYSGFWETAFDFSFTTGHWAQSALATAAFVGLLFAVRYAIRRWGKDSLVKRNLDFALVLFAMVWALFFIPAVRGTTFEMLERVSKLFHPSNIKVTPRLFIWKSALRMMRDRPAFGTGLDTFQISFPPYREALYWILEWNGTPEKAHNFVMQTAATMGFAGLLAFAWMHLAWIAQSLRDWRRQAVESRRLLLLAGFGAWLGFFVQNLFSFTVVGYGSLWWILWGLLAAMQHTWEQESGSLRQAEAQPGAHPALTAVSAAQAPAGAVLSAAAPAVSAGALAAPALAPLSAAQGGVPAGTGSWGGANGAWVAGVVFLAASLLACAAAGPAFFADEGANIIGLLAAAAGLVCLFLVLARGHGDPKGPGARGWVLVAACFIGVFSYSWYSVKIWVADSFYKQGQVGINAGQPGYAAIMYQKAAGQIEGPLTDDDLRSIHEAAVPTDPARRLKVHPGLNPDQELYWVKMGIAFENAAAEEPDPNKKLEYYRTALAVHQLTLEMNPINGYNYNNKGRVLKSMGEAFRQPEYFEKALEHYNKAIGLDVNNVYFNLDKANTLLNLGRVPESFAVCAELMQKFPDFASPYSYAGFMKMQAGQDADATALFEKAVAADWKGDQGSRSLAATNLGLLYGRAKRWQDAAGAFQTAVESNPGLADAYLRLADADLHLQRKPDAIAVLHRLLQNTPNQPQALELLKKLGAS